METFRSLFGKLLVFVYHCFDRIVIQGHLPLLSREGHIVFFFRDVRGEYPITPKVLQQRTNAYRAWVDAYAGNHKIPVEKDKKGVSKEEHVRPYLERMERGTASTLSSKAWSRGRVSNLSHPSMRPMIRTTGLSVATGSCTPICISTSGMKYWGPWQCAWGPIFRF